MLNMFEETKQIGAKYSNLITTQTAGEPKGAVRL
jgi:hypothetical protein